MIVAADDRRFMQLALALGRRGQGNVWPNPSVGCVIVRDKTIVGRGWTASGGRPHAETQALAQAADRSHGSDVYVTLEPCAHQGQTPPCAQALIDAGVKRVVVATGDPDLRVAGKGIAMLRDAGITVEFGVCEREANRDHVGFFSRITKNRPFVTLKLALSVDGRIATGTGDSQWITGATARRTVHAMRMRHDAIMVGAGTVRADDPTLTVRGFGTVRQPVRVVVSRKIDLPQDSQLAKTAETAPLWICHGPDQDSAATLWALKGAKVIECALGNGQVDMASALNALADRGLTRVFCEGGGALAASLLRADLVDELVVFTGGVAIGAEGIPGLAALGVETLSEAPRFSLKEHRKVDQDCMSIWTRN